MNYVYEAFVEWRKRKDNRSTWRETFSSALFFTTNPKHTDLESNPGPCSDGPATSCLSSGATKIDICFISELLKTIRPVRTQYNWHRPTLLIVDSCPV